MPEQVTKYGPCQDCGGHVKPCKCETMPKPIQVYENGGYFLFHEIYNEYKAGKIIFVNHKGETVTPSVFKRDNNGHSVTFHKDHIKNNTYLKNYEYFSDDQPDDADDICYNGNHPSVDGGCPVDGGLKPDQDTARLKLQDLKLIRAKLETMEHSGIFSLCPDVLKKMRGAVEGAIADVEIKKLNAKEK